MICLNRVLLTLGGLIVIHFEHQSKGITHLQEWKVGALFMEAGTGKTRVSCELISRAKDIDLVVWFAPVSIIRGKDGVPSIKDEVEKWRTFSTEVVYVGIESISASDRIYSETIGLISASRRPFVVVDESLKVKNSNAKRTKRMLEIGKMVEYKLILNGTPMSRNMMDLWAQMEFLSPKILSMTEQQFKNTFCKYTTVTKRIGRTQYTKEYITGYENVDYLHSLIRHYVYHCDLSLNISQNYRVMRYSISDENREEYNELKEHYLDDETLQWKNNNIFIEMTQKMQHVYCCDEAKFSVVDGLFKEIPEEDTIIFCKYISSREECEKRYPKAMVLSYQKDSLGLNMQRYHHTIYFDKIWDLALRIQSGRRTFRTGQEYDCYYYDLTGDVGLESMIDKNIEKKVDITEYFKKVNMDELREDL